jgi:hypothetical protein
LSPFFSKPLPSQFLHFGFFLIFGPFSLGMNVSKQCWVVSVGKRSPDKRSEIRIEFYDRHLFVMPALVAGIHVFLAARKGRDGWPGQARP